MNTTVLLLLAMYGLTFTLKDSSIFQNPRMWIMRRSTFMAQLLGCSFCTGWHTGWFVYGVWQLALYSAGSTVLGWHNLVNAVLYAFAGSTVSYVLDQIMIRVEVTDFNERSNIDPADWMQPTKAQQIIEKLDQVIDNRNADA